MKLYVAHLAYLLTGLPVASSFVSHGMKRCKSGMVVRIANPISTSPPSTDGNIFMPLASPVLECDEVGTKSEAMIMNILDKPGNNQMTILDIPEYQQTIQQNIQVHQEAIKQSEGTFYGFYAPDGFTTFDYENCPKEWISYSVDETYLMKKNTHANNVSTNPSERTNTNIWDAILQLEQRIIPPPFSSPTDLARVSKTPILSSSECHELITECESHYYGWGGSESRYGTPKDKVGYMIKLEDLSRSYSLVNFELLPRLFPAIMEAFPEALSSSNVKINTKAENMRLGGCRIVKYDANDGHVELGLHRDGLLITANIALNDLDEYEGGGTYVEGISSNYMNDPIRLKKGHVLLHPGDVLHGGAPITKGVRYVLVCFIFDTTIIPHEKYCQDRMQRDIEAARLIPLEDESRAQERVDLLASATTHCAEAYAFGKMASCGEVCDGYEEVARSFERYYDMHGGNMGTTSIPL